MKKSIASIGLLALVMILTSFTTPETVSATLNNDSVDISEGGIIADRKRDISEGGIIADRKRDISEGGIIADRKRDISEGGIIADKKRD